MMQLIHGNCLTEMNNLKADLVFTSPPYNMNLRIRNGKYCSRQIVKEFSTKYEGFDDNLPMDEYFDFNRQVIDKCLSVSPLVFYNVQFLTGNKVALFKLIGEYAETIKEIIVWDKVNVQPAMGQQILNSQYEVIIVFDRLNAISRKFDTGTFDRGTLSNHWSIKRGRKPIKNHGAIFPVELAEMVIKNFTKEGDTVLDPFMGSGTVGIACKKLNRNFIGIEMLDRYFNDAKKRIEDFVDH